MFFVKNAAELNCSNVLKVLTEPCFEGINFDMQLSKLDVNFHWNISGNSIKEEQLKNKRSK